jgi:predicted protein tyrosine phosphatase
VIGRILGIPAELNHAIRRALVKVCSRTVVMNLLFVCSECRLRSPTAEQVFGEIPGLKTIAAGTNHDATTPVSGDLLEWADIVLVMEKSHRNKLTKKFREQLQGKRLVVLGIPDKYAFMEPQLVELLKLRVAKYISADV